MSAEDANLPITNTLFPPPPAYFKAYTDMKLARFRDLSGEGEAGPSRPRVQAAPNNADVDPEGRTLTEEEEAELAGLRGQLEKPRADWVKEEGRWMCFGQMYTVSVTDFLGQRPLANCLTIYALQSIATAWS